MLNDFNIASHNDLSGKICLIRVDFNVPLKEGMITDDTRITRIIPGLRRLMEQGARLVLLSHLGRPKGKIVPELSLAPIASYVSKALGKEVPLIADLLSQEACNQCQSLQDGDVVLGENLRFWPEEEANDDDFASQLATLGDVFVQDAFSAAHRAHASTQAITNHLPSYVGDSLASELQALSDVLVAPEKPVVAVVGGAKVSTKLAVLENLVTRTDAIILGGGMANSFLGALGIDMKASLREADLYDTAKKIMAKAEASHCQILLPVDGLAATEFAAGAAHRAIANDAMADGEMMLDIGPASIAQAQDMIRNAKTVLWNGPMGAFEMAPFDTATIAVAQEVAQQTKQGKLVSVAGGGDTVAALNVAGVADDFSYLSLAGGAFLEWLEGKILPGIQSLKISK
ncbi:MAG: phosphoglycerate kinase [Candidatus Puniceispirillaceae bacterium]